MHDLIWGETAWRKFCTTTVLFFHDKEELFTLCVCEAVVQEQDLSELSLLNCTYSGTLISWEAVKFRKMFVLLDCHLNTVYTRVSQMKSLNIFYHGRYGVLIHDSYPDVRLFCSLLRGDFPSRWHQLLQWPLVSLLDVPDQVENVTELMPFMNFLVHLYTCCSDRHASPNWTSICRWILMGFTPSLLKKRLTERCSSLVHVASRAAIFTLLLRRHVAFLHHTATCRPLFKPSVSLLSTYKTIELCFEFLSHF